MEETMPKCEYCGKEITSKSHHSGRVKKFCDAECYRMSRNPADYRLTTCKYCGKVFKEKRDGINLYCSKKCSAKAVGEARTAERIKREDFDQEVAEHSADLIEKLREALDVVESLRFRIEHEKKCIVCGEWFMANNARQICCSPECSRKHDNALHDHRAARNGAPDTSITLSRLYRRDGGVCKICGRELNFEVDPQSGEYPSIDHIIPLARGGLHQWNNVQLACRRCNWEKGDRV